MSQSLAKELVLAFRSKLLLELGPFQGLSSEVETYLSAILADGRSTFVPRRQAEGDPEWKQLIPYVILRSGQEVFHYIRGQRATELRLRSEGSIGIGGHIEPKDLNLFSSPRTFYLEAAAREVAEEVSIEGGHRERIAALINDDTTPVGRVHFGIVHIWDLERPAVRKREHQITQCGFLSVSQLRKQRQALETWSQWCLSVLG